MNAMPSVPSSNPVEQHYTKGDLLQRIEDGLRAAGKDLAHLTTDDLAPIDQFHVGAKDSTLAVARLGGLKRGDNVLDVGGGIGGPARTLASELGCRVTVLDLTEMFIRTGKSLTARLGLQDAVTFVHGNALSMPFPDASFDVVWTQHATMNIADKAGLYREIHRVLRPGGVFVMHDVLAGPASGLRFPVPWASRAEISFLWPEAEVQKAIVAAGLRPGKWEDKTKDATAWVEERVNTMKQAMADPQRAAAPPFGVPLVLGPEAPAMMMNVYDGFQNGRLRVVQAAFGRA